MPSNHFDSPIKAIIDQLATHHYHRSSLPFLLPFLQDLSEGETESSMIYISEKLNIPPVEISSLLSFYKRPGTAAGKQKNIRLCRSMCFHKSQIKEIAQVLQNQLNLSFGETSADGNCSLNWVSCADDPQQSPVLWVNDRVFPQVKPEEIEKILSDSFNPNPPSNSTFIAPLFFSELFTESGIKSILAKGFKRHDYAKSDVLVCNVDEGEPLALKSRVLMMEYLPLVLEGMLISAYMNGSERGLIYLPNQYGYLKTELERKLSELYKRNLMGINILGCKGFNFDVQVLVGMGDYIGREESILAAMLMGYRPEFGAHGRDTLPYRIHSVDYYLKIAFLASNSPAPDQNFEKEVVNLPVLVSITGDCRRPGIYEIQDNMIIHDLLQKVGADDACVVQIGGVSAPMTIAEDFDRIINPFDLARTGSIIIYGPQTDLLEAAKDILAYFHETSCGQCVPCRNGIPVLMKSLQSYTSRKQMRPALPEIRSLAETIQLASKCHLGQCAPNAYLSILDIAEQDLHSGRLSR